MHATATNQLFMTVDNKFISVNHIVPRNYVEEKSICPIKSQPTEIYGMRKLKMDRKMAQRDPIDTDSVRENWCYLKRMNDELRRLTTVRNFTECNSLYDRL